MFTAEDKLREIERELKLRRRLYPSWIATGKLDERDARRQIAVLMEIASDYVKQAYHMSKERLAVYRYTGKRAEIDRLISWLLDKGYWFDDVRLADDYEEDGQPEWELVCGQEVPVDGTER